jgi:hypothetical protein
MKKLIFWQSLFVFVGTAAIAYFLGVDGAASYCFGAVGVTANLLLHVLVWGYMIGRKKLIAFAVALIVFKYAIFGAIVYKILGLTWVSPLWFCVGVGTFVVTSVIVALSREEYVI